MLRDLDSYSEYKYDDIADKDKTFSPDRTLALYKYVSAHREDRYDNDMNYQIVVWKVADKREVNVICKACRESYYLNSRDPDIVSVGFSEDGNHVVTRYDNGMEEKDPVQRPPIKSPIFSEA